MLRATAILFSIAIASPVVAQELDWPKSLLGPLAESTRAMAAADGIAEREEAYTAAREALVAHADLPGAGLMLEMADIQMSSEAAVEEISAIIAELGAADPDDVATQALGLLTAIDRLSSTSIPILPSTANEIAEAIARYDDAAERVGAPSLRELVADRLPDEIGDALNGTLDRIDQMNELFEDLDELANGDVEAVDDFATNFLGLLPESVAGPNMGQQVVIVELVQWDARMYDAATDGLDIVADAMETGQVDTARLQEVTDRLNELGRTGPWGADTARAFARAWCEQLPVLSDLCGELLVGVIDVATETSIWTGRWLTGWGVIEISGGFGSVTIVGEDGGFLQRWDGILTVTSADEMVITGTYHFESIGDRGEFVFFLIPPGNEFTGQITGDRERSLDGIRRR